MNEEKPKLKTFRDLRSLNSTSTTSSPSISSSTSISSTTSRPNPVNTDSDNISTSSTRYTSTTSTTKEKKSDSRKKKSVPKKKQENKEKILNSPRKLSSTSPDKDFQKIPNSVIRNAMPLGLFRGKSKQVYDYLWSISRGAINPKREVTVTRNQIKAKAGLGSMVTVDSAINHLQNIGLIERSTSVGSARGNTYEIFTIEENDTRYTSTTSISRLSQKVDVLDVLESGISSITQTVDNQTAYSHPNTSLKTLNNDDEKNSAFAEFIEEISEASKRLTGKGIKKTEREKWGEVAKLLVVELELAAARTEAVSSVPAFLKEVLRRKLETKPAEAKNKPAKVSTQMQVGKPQPETPSELVEWEREPLTSEERKKTLSVMRERKAEGYLELVKSMEQTYTAEDWKWLMEELEK